MSNMPLYIRLMDATKAAGVKVKTIATQAFDIAPAALSAWIRSGVPLKYEHKVERLCAILEDAVQKKILPKSQDELVWSGLIHETECVKRTLDPA